MQNIKNKIFELDNYSGFTIMDEHFNRWDGETEPYQVNICLDSNSNCGSLIEVKISEFKVADRFEVIQVADNTNKSEVVDFVKQNHSELIKLLDEKLLDPSYNGEC